MGVAHALDGDVEVDARDVDADDGDSRAMEPLRRPGVAAAAVEEGFTLLQLQQLQHGSIERDEIERELRIPRIERRAVTGAEERGILDLVLDRHLRVLVMRSRIRVRGVEGRGTERERILRQFRRHGAGDVAQACGVGVEVAQVIGQDFREPMGDRIPASAARTEQDPFVELHGEITRRIGCTTGKCVQTRETLARADVVRKRPQPGTGADTRAAAEGPGWNFRRLFPIRKAGEFAVAGLARQDVKERVSH